MTTPNDKQTTSESPSCDAACYTIFYDMSSGGSEKESFTKLAVKLPESEAVEWFEKTFGRDPHNVTCQCCGADYAVYEKKDTDRADVVVDDPSGYNAERIHGGAGITNQPKTPTPLDGASC